MSTQASVVVGVDGSPESMVAVAWAAAEAQRRHRPLQIVYANVWPMVSPPPGAPPPAVYRDMFREQGRELLAEAARQATGIAPEVEVRTDMPEQAAAWALIDRSRDAAVVVVGNRGLGGFAGLLLGSVAVQVAAHAASPVVIVRAPVAGSGPNAGRVVVGVDGSPANAPAIGFAFEQAAWRGVGLTAVHAYGWPAGGEVSDTLPLVYDADDLRAVAERVLAEALAGWREKFPDVDVRLDLVQRRPRAALREAAAGAELLVVGARGRGGVTGLLLGSVSQDAIHHAPCTVAVARHAVAG